MSSTLSPKPPTGSHQYGEHKNDILETTMSKEDLAWRGAHKGVQSSPHGWDSCADEEEDSNPVPSSIRNWMKFSERWFAKILSPLMQLRIRGILRNFLQCEGEEFQ